MKKKRKKNKRNYDKKVKCSKLDIRDRVLVRQKAFKAKHKVQDKWEDNTYVVIDQPAKDTPVCTVQKEGVRLKTLHRNMLFLLSQELQCEDNSQKMKISNSDMEDNCEDSSDRKTDQDEKQEYMDPVIRYRARA